MKSEIGPATLLQAQIIVVRKRCSSIERNYKFGIEARRPACKKQQ